MDLVKELDSKIEILINSPIYAMSLGSKELFHSNFWGWLIETDNNYASVFFPEVDISSIKSIEREKGNRDLTIYLKDDSCYVIENKIKSLPKLNQLIEYKKNTKGFIKGLLTGIIPTLNLKNDDYWMFISYKDIAKKIKNLTDLSNKFIIKKNKGIIYEYCETLEALSDIISKRLIETSNNLIYDSGSLWKIRFDDVYKKFKAEDFAERYLYDSQELKKLTPVGFSLKTSTDFSNKNAIIDVRFYIKDVMCIGIQIQGEQFRIIAERSISNKCDEVFSEFLEYSWFDLKIIKNGNIKYIKGNKTKMSPEGGKAYNKYETSYYSFVYQYFNLFEEITDYNVLFKLILDYMAFAKDIIEKNNFSN